MRIPIPIEPKNIALLNKVIQGGNDSCNFIYTPKEGTLYVAYGQGDNTFDITLDVPLNRDLKKRSFSLSGDYVKTLYTHFKREKIIPFIMEVDTNGNYLPEVTVRDKKGKHRSARVTPFDKSVLNKKEETVALQDYKSSHLHKLLMLLEQYKPYLFINVNASKRTVDIKKASNTITLDIPQNIDIPEDFIWNQKTSDALSVFCSTRDDEIIKIGCIQGTVTIRVLQMNNSRQTITQDGLNEAFNNKLDTYTTLRKIMILIEDLIKPLADDVNDIPIINDANEGYISITENDIYLIEAVDIYAFNKHIDISNNQNYFRDDNGHESIHTPSLFKFQLSNIIKVKKDGINGKGLVRVDLMMSSQGKNYALGFYKKKSHCDPSAIVPIDVETDIDDINKINSLIKAQSIITNDDFSLPGTQLELVGT